MSWYEIKPGILILKILTITAAAHCINDRSLLFNVAEIKDFNFILKLSYHWIIVVNDIQHDSVWSYYDTYQVLF